MSKLLLLNLAQDLRSHQAHTRLENKCFAGGDDFLLVSQRKGIKTPENL